MRRSLASFLLLILSTAISLLAITVGGSVFVVQIIPLCGIAIIYGFVGVLFGIIYLSLLVVALTSIGFPLIPPLWQAVAMLLLPLFTAWVSVLRTRGRDLECMQRRLLEGMRDGVILASPEYVIHLVNPAACMLLLLPEKESDRLAYLREIGIYQQWEQCAMMRPGALTREYTLCVWTLQVTVAPVFEGKALSGLVTTIVDFTAERQLARIREDFFAFVSHELRNPLTSISGFAEIMQMRANTEKFPEYAGVIKRNTDRMLRLTEDLLQMTTFEVGSFQLKHETADLVELVHRAVTCMTPIADQAGLTVSESYPSEPVWGNYDPDRLLQVVTNLLDNAVKFSPRGSVIEVRLTCTDDASVLVEVHDAGPGIPEEEIEAIFDKYYQSSTGRASKRGAGLGLAISKSLVEHHGGTIRAENRVEGGAVFLVQLPRSVYEQESIWQMPDDMPLLKVAESGPRYDYSTPEGE